MARGRGASAAARCGGHAGWAVGATAEPAEDPWHEQQKPAEGPWHAEEEPVLQHVVGGMQDGPLEQQLSRLRTHGTSSRSQLRVHGTRKRSQCCSTLWGACRMGRW